MQTQAVGIISAATLADPAVNAVVGTVLDDDDIGFASLVRVALANTGVTGTTPSISLQVQSSVDNTNWTNEGAALAITAAQYAVRDIDNFKGRFLRVIVSAKAGTTPGLTGLSITAYGKG